MSAHTIDQKLLMELVTEAKHTNHLLEQLLEAVNSANAKLADISENTHRANL